MAYYGSNCFKSSVFSSFTYAQNDTTAYKIASMPYNLFHPVPKNEMKEMATDRPDVTESAYTVAPGHFQIESDLINMCEIRTE